MPQSRGMVKIAPAGSGTIGILDALGAVSDWIVDFVPYFIDFYNTMQDSTNEFDSRQLTDSVQGFWSYIMDMGYTFYVDDLQVIYHGKDTETFRTGTGTSTGVQTNKDVYREYKMKTTISERDWDVVNRMWSKNAQNLHNRDMNPLDYISGAFQDYWNASGGYNIALEYLEKRQKFLRDLDGVDLTISSSMFLPANVKMTEYTYQVTAGQQETTYTLSFKEVTSEEDVQNNTGQDAIEPGADASGAT
jgi:hypothetical protein